MALVNNDITFRYSGGQLNYDKNQSYGGAVSQYEITGANTLNLFSPISQESRDAGATVGTVPGTRDYRVFYIHCRAAGDGNGVAGKIWASLNSTISAVKYRIAIGKKNTIIPKAINATVQPSGLWWTDLKDTQLSGRALPVIEAGDFIPVVIERSITATGLTMPLGGIELSIYFQSIDEELLSVFDSRYDIAMDATTYGDPNLLPKTPYPAAFIDDYTPDPLWTAQGKKVLVPYGIEDGSGIRDLPLLILPSDGNTVDWELRMWCFDRYSGLYHAPAEVNIESGTGRRVVYIFKPSIEPIYLETMSVSSGTLEVRHNSLLAKVM